MREEARAAKRHGLTAVPYFLIDGQVVVTSAQSVETFAAALEHAWAASVGAR